MAGAAEVEQSCPKKGTRSPVLPWIHTVAPPRRTKAVAKYGTLSGSTAASAATRSLGQLACST